MLAVASTGLCEAALGETYSDRALLLRDGYLPEKKPMELIVLRGTTFEEHMLANIEARNAYFSIEDYQLTPDGFRQAYTDLIDGHPELFFVSDSYLYWLNSNGFISHIEISFLYSEEEIASRTKAYNASVSTIVSYALQANNTLGQVMLVHDYLCANYEYDQTFTVYSAEQMFKQGTGVCQAYLQCFQGVMNAMDIDCVPVTSASMNHGWNAVKIDGSWYHLDATWDDPVSDMPLRARHKYFLLSDAGMEEADHSNWSAAVSALNTQFDSFFWSDINTAIPVVGDTMYYAVKDPETNGLYRTVMAWNMEANTTSEFCTYKITSVNGINRAYSGYYPISATSTHLYYLTMDCVYSVPLEGGEPTLAYADTRGDYFWTSFSDGKYVYIFSSPAPGQGGSVTDVRTSRANIVVNTRVMELRVGDTFQFTARLMPGNVSEFTWTPDQPSVVSADSTGLVTALSPGVAKITCDFHNVINGECIVVVFGDEEIFLPPSTTIVEEEAFAGTAVKAVTVRYETTKIGARAFADCGELYYVFLPRTVVDIAPDAFENSPNLTIGCFSGSYAESYAQEHNLNYFTY